MSGESVEIGKRELLELLTEDFSSDDMLYGCQAKLTKGFSVIPIALVNHLLYLKDHT